MEILNEEEEQRIEEEREAIFKGKTIFKLEGNDEPTQQKFRICNRGSRVDMVSRKATILQLQKVWACQKGLPSHKQLTS